MYTAKLTSWHSRLCKSEQLSFPPHATLSRRFVSCASKLRRFPIGRNERTVLDVTYPTIEDFLERMDAGDFDGNLHVEIKKLSKEQLSALGVILLDRSAKPHFRR